MHTEIRVGKIFNSIPNVNQDTEELRSKIVETTTRLLDSHNSTNIDHPGMLLGKIQSGKTSAFIRIIGLGFDNGFDIAIVLTKGTVALTDQTVRRLKKTFRAALENDWVEIFDIMQHQGDFTRYELGKKMIIVVKKQRHNLEKVATLLTEKHPDLAQKHIVIIDDEADYASIGFRTIRNDSGGKDIDAAKIPKLINELRSKVQSAAYLQVTATPYALYLQPETYELNFVFKPTRPAFSVVLPTYPSYVGSDFYFGDNENGEPKAPYVFSEIKENELSDMTPKKKTGRADGRSFQLGEVLIPNKIPTLRQAILNFVVGVSIRRLQQERVSNGPAKKYAFIVHTDTHRVTHDWQKNVVFELLKTLEDLVISNESLLREMLKLGLTDLKRSISQMQFPLPEEELVIDRAVSSIRNGEVAIDVVNSDNDVKQMLDEDGQLRLRVPMNIFIGGQALDRGITIDNLIGFYYGRNPGKYQQDTVLQHSRMYGNRSKEDLSVTRFYTTSNVHLILRRINEIDEVLRNALKTAGGDHGIVFIQKDSSGKIVPCSPNKILLSSTTTLKPGKRLLPVGFELLPAYKIRPHIEKIDQIIGTAIDEAEPMLVSLEDAAIMIKESFACFDSEKSIEAGSSEAEIQSALNYLVGRNNDLKNQNKVYVLSRGNRNASRERQNEKRFENSPDTEKREGEIAKRFGVNIPVLIMLKQNGGQEHGWKSGPFWWPVLMAQQDIEPAIYASETQEWSNIDLI